MMFAVCSGQYLLKVVQGRMSDRVMLMRNEGWAMWSDRKLSITKIRDQYKNRKGGEVPIIKKLVVHLLF